MIYYMWTCTAVVSAFLVWLLYGLLHEIVRAAGQTVRRVRLLREMKIKPKSFSIYWHEFSSEFFASYDSISFGGSRALYQKKPYFRDEDQ